MTVYDPQISQDLDSLASILKSIFQIGSLTVAGVGVIIAVVGAIISFVFAVAYYLLQAIPLYKMAKKAGHKNAWMAFIPYANDFLTFVLPHREFNLFNWIKTDRRDLAALAYLVLTLFGSIISAILTLILSYVPVIGPMASTVVSLAVTFAIWVLRWRMYYDLLMTFGQEKNAMWVSVISIAIPWLFMIFTLISCKNDPEYGAGNYYVDNSEILEEG